MMTTEEMSQQTGINIRTIQRAIKDQRLTAQKKGRDWFIERDQKFDYFVNQHRPREQKK